MELLHDSFFKHVKKHYPTYTDMRIERIWFSHLSKGTINSRNAKVLLHEILLKQHSPERPPLKKLTHRQTTPLFGG